MGEKAWTTRRTGADEEDAMIDHIMIDNTSILMSCCCCGLLLLLLRLHPKPALLPAGKVPRGRLGPLLLIIIIFIIRMISLYQPQGTW